MTTTIVQGPTTDIEIPGWVTDLAAFRRWADSESFPTQGRLSWLAGNLIMDISMEQVYWHNQIKTEIAFGILTLLRQTQTGRFYTDGVRVTHPEADLSVEPDGCYVAYDSVRSGRLRLVASRRTGGVVELEGSPDMVLEVLSPESQRKDTVELRELYFRAGVSEYWLADARAEPLRFEILRRGTTNFETVPAAADGSVRSEVFGRRFRLTAASDPLGQPTYTLAAEP